MSIKYYQELTWPRNRFHVHLFLPLLSIIVLFFQLAGVVNEVRTLTDSHNVVCAGPFIYACVEEVSINNYL